MVYKWRTGFYKTSAEVAAEEMNRLAASNNLTAKALVDASRPVDAPLHDEFEWDDSIAAEKWREQEARVMIASITVIADENAQAEPVRAFFNIEPSTPIYEPVQTIVRDSSKSDRLFTQAMEELESFQRKYNSIKEFSKLFLEIDHIRASHNKSS